jgi:hypothetical protein
MTMGKSTGRMTGLASFVVASLLCSAGTVAYGAASVNVSAQNANPGDQVTFTATLATGGASVGGVQNDIRFNTPLSIPTAATGTGTCSMGYCNTTTTTQCSSNDGCPAGTCSVTTATPCHTGSDCPSGETCQGGQNCVTACLTNADCKNGATCQVPSTGPQCTAGASLGDKQALFSFPRTCSTTTTQPCVSDPDCPSGETCPPQTTNMRAVIAGIDPPAGNCSVTTATVCHASSDCPSGETCNINPIPDNTVLYTCTMNVATDAAPATYPLTTSTVLMADPSGNAIAGALGTDGSVTVCPPEGCAATPFLVCDVVPFTGDNVGEFGGSGIKNNDVVAIFNASLETGVVPAAGTARFSAMDSVTADTPPTCGGNGKLLNNDVVACFNRSLGNGDNFDRTISDSTCASTLVPQ